MGGKALGWRSERVDKAEHTGSAANMHHSSKMAESAAYDKHGSDRIVAAAMRAANEFALQF